MKYVGPTFHNFIQNTLVFDKNNKIFAITPQDPKKYFYFGALKILLSKIMNGDPPVTVSYFQNTTNVKNMHLHRDSKVNI